MDFLKVKKFRKVHKPDPEKGLEDNNVPQPEEPNNCNVGGDIDLNGSSKADPAAAEVEDDDDDDFITNEVKRRLKELRRNSFMVLIPEEEEEELYLEDEEAEAGETSSSDWRDVEAEGRQWWGGFDAVYEKYCERMLFFDRIIAQQVKNTGSTNPSPKFASKKLSSPLSCLSLKKIEEPNEDTEHLQLPTKDPYNDLEIAYVAQICLTWEALHCQYTQLTQIVLCQPDNPACYNHSAQLLQQFQVLLQRFIENEPFQDGLRAEIYARARHVLPKLLQIPNIQGSDQKAKVEEESDYLVLAPDIIKIIESVILTFQLFVKIDKKKHSLFGNQNPMATPLQQVQSLLEKKGMKLKELRKKRKGWKKKSWPLTQDDVPLLFGLIDIKIISRVLRTASISKEQLFWCEEKIKKLDLCDGKLQRDPSPILFPC
ncbi:hypothetical protein V6N13_093146 [Hibiscus sabdariffa]|uniref:Uncharacterized protein n=2 Tax=Hibiscus sabdariffa TaxID=183260 RepID=A0ABR2A2Y7_9ROSI